MEASDYNVASSSALQDVQAERERSRTTAERYRCPFVDLNEVRIDPELFRSTLSDAHCICDMRVAPH